MGIRATIDGVEVPVDGGEVPAFSFSVLDLEDPEKIKGAESTSFKMPATNAVRQVMGGYGMSEVGQTRHTLVIGNGTQVMYQSRVIPIEKSADQYTCVAVGDNAEWFDLAKDKKLRDIDLGESETITDTLQRESWVDDEQALCFPLIDFGSFEDRLSSFNVTVNKLRPAIRTHVLLRAAFAAWGYSLKPMGGLASLWKKLCIPSTWGEIAISDSFRFAASAGFFQSTPLTWSTLGVQHEITFASISNDPSGTYTGVGRYTPPYTQDTDVIFTYDFSAQVAAPFPTPAILQAYVTLYDFANNIVLATQLLAFTPSTLDQAGVMNFGTFSVSGADELGIRVRLVSVATIHNLTLNDGSIQYNVTGLEYQEGVTVDIAGQAPDMTVMELLKSIANNRCLIFRTNAAHGEVQVWQDVDFYRDTSTGIVWRDRVNHNNAAIKELPLYPRRMEYRWKEDDEDQTVIDLNTQIGEPGYGNADIVLDGGAKDTVEVEMKFAPTGMAWAFENALFLPRIYKVEGTYQVDTYEFEPRLLIMEGVAPGAWRFDGVDETEYPKCYFVHPQGKWTLSFRQESVFGGPMTGGSMEGTATLQWGGRHRRMKSPRLRCDVMIHPDEVWNLDQGIPRLVNDGFTDLWMYVANVDQFRFDKAEYTECTLIPV